MPVVAMSTHVNGNIYMLNKFSVTCDVIDRVLQLVPDGITLTKQPVAAANEVVTRDLILAVKVYL